MYAVYQLRNAAVDLHCTGAIASTANKLLAPMAPGNQFEWAGLPSVTRLPTGYAGESAREMGHFYQHCGHCSLGRQSRL